MTRLRTRGPALAIVVALAAFATACGGGGRLSAREYVREASRICRHATHRVARAEHVREEAAGQADAAKALADLRPPESLARFDAVWVALVRQSSAELEALLVAVRNGDHEGAAQRREALGLLTERAAELARSQGISACPSRFTRSGAAPAESRA